MRNTLYVIVLLITVFLLSCVTSQSVVQRVEPADDVVVKEIEVNDSAPADESLWGSTPKGFVYFNDPPSKINEAPLRYPKFAKDARIQGTVELELEILTNGRFGAVDVRKSIMSGPGGLDEAAIEYARRLQFEPAKANGKLVAVWVTFPVDFFLG